MIRYIDRPVSELRTGDRFTFTDETDMHTCAGPYSESETVGSGTVAVEDSAVVIDVASPDQTVLVAVEIIRVNVTLRLEVDAKRWAREFSFGSETAAAVADDVRSYFDPTGLIPPHLKGIVGIKDTDTALDPVGK
jgi:hypothetical protein